MHIKHTFRTALKGITTNKSRSILTMLGIIIGVGSVILITSIGDSFSGTILSQVDSLGANSITISPGGSDGGPRQPGGSNTTDSLTLGDVEALKKLTTLQSVSPSISISGKTTSGNRETSAPVTGVTEVYFQNQSISIAEGRLLSDSDDQGQRFVAVLGPDAATDLFGATRPIDKNITIMKRSFKVVGVTETAGSASFQNPDRQIFIPFSTAQRIAGQQYVNSITVIAATDAKLAEWDVTSLLRQRHGIRRIDGEYDDDFSIFSAEEITATVGTITSALTIFLSSIAAISLLVGGIGIMNIMLVTVTERTREIGLRKALGAKQRDILLQFLIEAVLMTFTGGVIGMIFGLGIAFIASLIVPRFVDGYAFAVSLNSILLATGLSTVVVLNI